MALFFVALFGTSYNQWSAARSFRYSYFFQQLVAVLSYHKIKI